MAAENTAQKAVENLGVLRQAAWQFALKDLLGLKLSSLEFASLKEKSAVCELKAGPIAAGALGLKGAAALSSPVAEALADPARRQEILEASQDEAEILEGLSSALRFYTALLKSLSSSGTQNLEDTLSEAQRAGILRPALSVSDALLAVIGHPLFAEDGALEDEPYLEDHTESAYAFLERAQTAVQDFDFQGLGLSENVYRAALSASSQDLKSLARARTKAVREKREKRELKVSLLMLIGCGASIFTAPNFILPVLIWSVIVFVTIPPRSSSKWVRSIYLLFALSYASALVLLFLSGIFAFALRDGVMLGLFAILLIGAGSRLREKVPFLHSLGGLLMIGGGTALSCSLISGLYALLTVNLGLSIKVSQGISGVPFFILCVFAAYLSYQGRNTEKTA